MNKVFLISLLSFPILAACQTTFFRTIGDKGYYSGVKAIEDNQHNIVILANRTGFSGNSNFIIYKFDLNGNLLKEMIHSQTSMDVATSFRLLDNAYVICGYTLTNSNDYQMMAVKMDTSGNTIWRKTYGGQSWDFINDIEIVDTNTIMICGKTYGYLSGRAVCFSGILSSTGDSLDFHHFVFQGDGDCREIFKDNDSVFYVAAINSYQQKSNAILMKLDITADTLSVFKVDTSAIIEVHSLTRVNANTLALGGIIKANSTADQDALILYIDGDTNYRITQAHGGNQDDAFFSLYYVNTDTLLAAGQTKSYAIGGSETYSVHVDNGGWWVRSFAFGNKYNESFKSVIALSDKSFLFTGTTESFGAAQSNVMIIKTLGDFSVDTSNYVNITSTHSIEQYTTGVLIRPNPASNYISVNWVESREDVEKIEFINLQGICCLSVLKPEPKKQIFISDLASGVYVVKVSSLTGSYHEKLIICKD